MKVERCNYLISTTKTNGQNLNQNELINIGYMAGRYGISLDGNLNRDFKPIITDKGYLININSCTTNALEENLNKAGIKFNILA